MNWKQKIDEIYKKYENAKNTYNEQVLKQKRKELVQQAKALLDAYNAQQSKRRSEVQAELKEVNEKLEKMGKPPVFNLKHFFTKKEIKNDYGTVVGHEEVIDVAYIEGIRYLSEYVEKTLSRLKDVTEYRRAIDEILETENEQALSVLHGLISDNYYPSFVRTEEVQDSKLSAGARLSQGKGLNTSSSEYKAVVAIHEMVKDAHKKATYPKDLFELEEKKKALVEERYNLSGALGADDTSTYIYNVTAKIEADQSFGSGKDDPFNQWR